MVKEIKTYFQEEGYDGLLCFAGGLCSLCFGLVTCFYLPKEDVGIGVIAILFGLFAMLCAC